MRTVTRRGSAPMPTPVTVPEAPMSGAVARAAALAAADVLRELGVPAASGLTSEEAARRRERYGPNAVASHRARFLPVLWHQLRSPLLGLLLAAAVTSYFVGERADAVVIGVIVAKRIFYREPKRQPAPRRRQPGPKRHLRRRAAYFSTRRHKATALSR